MGYERRGSEVWWVPDGMKLEGGFELPEAQIGPFERQAINPKLVENLVQRMIADGRPIEEQCRVEVTPPLIILGAMEAKE